MVAPVHNPSPRPRPAHTAVANPRCPKISITLPIVLLLESTPPKQTGLDTPISNAVVFEEDKRRTRASWCVFWLRPRRCTAFLLLLSWSSMIAAVDVCVFRTCVWLRRQDCRGRW